MTVEEIVENPEFLPMVEIYREKGLPPYLQHDLDAFKEGLASGSTLIDCLWCELYGSINGAEIDDQAITHEHAEYLRDKYLRGMAR